MKIILYISGGILILGLIVIVPIVVFCAIVQRRVKNRKFELTNNVSYGQCVHVDGLETGEDDRTAETYQKYHGTGEGPKSKKYRAPIQENEYATPSTRNYDQQKAVEVRELEHEALDPATGAQSNLAYGIPANTPIPPCKPNK